MTIFPAEIKAGFWGTVLTTTLSYSTTKQPTPFPVKSPNIILIYLDDMGNGDLSLTGATGYTTPHIDKLAGEGLRFTHFYSPQAVSTASRAGLLTGCYPNRIGLSGALGPQSPIGISDGEITIAEMLKEKA